MSVDRDPSALDNQIVVAESPNRAGPLHLDFRSPVFSACRPTWAEIDLANLVHNFRATRERLGPNVAIMPAIKANGYGHGAVECAQALEFAGAEWFGVAMPEEGVKLRANGVTRPILCLGGFWEGQEEALLNARLTPVIFRVDLLERLDRAARAAGVIADYHLKVDTGMNRLGVPYSDLPAFLEAASQLENTRLDGVMTHLAAADEKEKIEFTRRQTLLFSEALTAIRARGFKPTWIHQANSAGACFPEYIPGGIVRIGALIYGYWRDIVMPDTPPLDLRPVMSLRTRIAFLKTVPAGAALGYGCTYVTERESRIATLPIGYADGLSRSLSNTGRVLVCACYAPIVGRISMDLTLIDVTDIKAAGTGDEVVLIGRQGDNEITVEEIARTSGTISYEVTCGLSERVPRVYMPFA